MIFRKKPANPTPEPDNQEQAPEEQASAVEPGDEELAEKVGLFTRLKRGISRTSSNLAVKVRSLVAGGALDDEFYDELLEALIGADVGLATGEKIVARIREQARARKLKDRSQIIELLQDAISSLLQSATPAAHGEADPDGLTVLLIIGVNGTGKTTTIGKLGARFKTRGRKVLFAAADTFRAAAIEQLTIWAERAGVDIIKQGEGADPSAVVFDAMSAALARQSDLLIVDTAGRLHTKVNLMEELKKIKRVIRRKAEDAAVEILLVIDATTGQNGIQQARTFAAALEQVHGIILTKLDGTAKGGIVIPIVDQLSIPIRYIGIGEGLDDLLEFDPEAFARALVDMPEPEQQ